MKILVADDSRTMRRVFRTALEAMGHGPTDVLEAGDSVEAFAILKSRQYDVDLIIADLDMPGMEGHSFLRRVKAEAPNRKIPVLLCINPNQRRYAQEAAQHATVEFLERPFRDNDLRQRISAIEGAMKAKKSKEASEFLRTIVSTAEAEADLPFLVQLPSYVMKELLQLSTQATWEQGQVIVKEGDPVDSLHIVSLGEVDLVKGGQVTETARTGDCFLELAFMASEASPAEARAKTWTQTVSLPRPKLADLLRHQPKMGQYLSSLAARRSKVLNKPALRPDSEFAGNMSSMSFPDVLQLLQLGRKTGVLEFSRAGKRGEIHVESGDVRHAAADGVKGDDAFFAIAAWRDASFAFSSCAVSGPKTITQPTMSLLMEAMRRLDESSRGTDSLARYPASPGNPFEEQNARPA